MKTIWTILALLTAGTLTCAGRHKCVVGTDIASAISKGIISVYAGHSFSRNWSAEVEIGINAARLTKGPDNDTKVHWEELYGTEASIRKLCEKHLVESGISFLFWPSMPYKGVVISIGCSIKDRSRPDITVAAGYYCRIWKGITAVIMYKRGIMESISNDSMHEKHFKIGVSYVF